MIMTHIIRVMLQVYSRLHFGMLSAAYRGECVAGNDICVHKFVVQVQQSSKDHRGAIALSVRATFTAI